MNISESTVLTAPLRMTIFNSLLPFSSTMACQKRKLWIFKYCDTYVHKLMKCLNINKYTWKKVRVHRLWSKGKLSTKIFLHSKNVLNRSIKHNLQYSKFLRHENDGYRAITASDSSLLGYRNLISYFRTPLIFLAIKLPP